MNKDLPGAVIDTVRDLAASNGMPGTFDVAEIREDADWYAVVYGPREADDDPDFVMLGLLPAFVNKSTGSIGYPDGIRGPLDVLDRLDAMTVVGKG